VARHFHFIHHFRFKIGALPAHSAALCRRPMRKVRESSMMFVRSGLFCASLMAFANALALPAVHAADVAVTLDQATLLKLPERVATIVIGNPLIADASVQAGGMLVITGKGYGITNLIVLDRAGSVLMEKSVEVEGPRDVVVVYRGMARESYSCTPDCERRITLGDADPYFAATLAQTAARNAQAQGAAPAGR
jgi:Flp pilus assembly secretin CpaC